MESLILYVGFTFFLTIWALLFKNYKKILIVSTSVALCLFYGLRVGIGNDYLQYNNIYDQINYNYYSAIEPTFIILSKLLKPFEYGFNYLMAIYAFVTFVFCYAGIKKYSIYSYVPVFMFSTGFIFFIDNQIRQALAVSFFIYYMRYISSREIGKYILCVFLSTIFFHFSSIILMFAYFIRRERVKKVVWFSLILVAYILMRTDVVNLILEKIISFIPYYSDIYFSRFDVATIQSGSGLGILFWLLIACFIITYSHEIDDVFVVNLFLIGTIINTIFINYDIFERISFYFIYLRFILLAIIIKKIILKNNIGFLLSIIITILTVAFTSYEVINDANKHGSVPLNLLYYKVDL